MKTYIISTKAVYANTIKPTVLPKIIYNKSFTYDLQKAISTLIHYCQTLHLLF